MLKKKKTRENKLLPEYNSSTLVLGHHETELHP